MWYFFRILHNPTLKKYIIIFKNNSIQYKNHHASVTFSSVTDSSVTTGSVTDESVTAKKHNSKHQDGNERVDNPETLYTLRDESVIKTTKE